MTYFLFLPLSLINWVRPADLVMVPVEDFRHEAGKGGKSRGNYTSQLGITGERSIYIPD